ncbi:MAG: alpha/beta fold hydrolase [Pseudodesulfovibrio sp.]|uniref:alpha/beta fold hydrolase n=1 Tax=Pseudodesulfovibrio sp. TaxID=2035812 RepID=UPI003D0ABC77
MRRLVRSLMAAALAALLLAGCAGRIDPAVLAGDAGLAPISFSGKYFDMVGYERGAGPVLRVYIEGDGMAWRTWNRPSSDPTPKRPVGLMLAATDTHDAVLYLARPCQYVEGGLRRNCATPLWTSARFSEPVIAEMNAFLDQAKARAHADRLRLLGYSGGGCVALLLAERRKDVDVVVTVAGNIDHSFWTRWHNVSPLHDSLDPLNDKTALRALPQLHIVSRDDSVMPPAIAERYAAELGHPDNVRIVTVDGVGHSGDWRDVVPGILAQSGLW